MRKSAAWREYQETAAALFRRMGFEAVVEETLEGVRGRHEVDVVVRTKLGGVPTTWIVECKYWKSRVPKAHVLTLVQIAQDVGADRAFLLSEEGFQAGAIAVARKTNVSLTNVEELEAAATEHISELSIRKALTEVKALEYDLHTLLFRQVVRVPLHPQVDEIITLLGACLEVTMAAIAALTGRFPVHLPIMLSVTEPPCENEISKVVRALLENVDGIRERFATLKTTMSVIACKAADTAEELVHCVYELLACGEALLEKTSVAEGQEAKLRAALVAMRAIGDHAEALREHPMAELRRAVRGLMKEMFDGVYLWIGNPHRTTVCWIGLKAKTEEAISNLLRVAEELRVSAAL
ncbi:restriction endonuclease [Azospirillum isscasi]|uniref:Restriction endonuclease n=1 Tax=Azospirillum isscasi TaxID=3053926 RepID=A0ABU0WQF7_9PROT|nr:restriction endonuclease [Azospirillum isscasi]MDQ2106482.1 restriction endonuclease [Azospirillum isscasi]